MSNLIITIISIALVAVAAIMGIYYGGTAFENAQINALASTLISQGKQVYAANELYMINNGFSSFTDFPDNAINTSVYLSAPVPILNMTTSYSTYNAYNYYCNGSGSNIGKVSASISRSHANILPRTGSNTNAIIYSIVGGNPNTPGDGCGGGPSGGGTNTYTLDFSPATMSNNPLVLLCKAVNKINGISPNASIGGMTSSGLPYYNYGNTYNFGLDATSANGTYANYYYVGDPAAVNFCYLISTGYYGPYSVMIIAISG